jgi:dTMP kinase
LLDISASDSRTRVESTGEKKDRLENSKLDFFERTRAKFLELANDDLLQNGGRFVLIDANDSIENIHAQIVEVVTKVLQKG